MYATMCFFTVLIERLKGRYRTTAFVNDSIWFVSFHFVFVCFCLAFFLFLLLFQCHKRLIMTQWIIFRLNFWSSLCFFFLNIRIIMDYFKLNIQVNAVMLWWEFKASSIAQSIKLDINVLLSFSMNFFSFVSNRIFVYQIVYSVSYCSHQNI